MTVFQGITLNRKKHHKHVPEDIVVILNTPDTDLTITTFLAAASADDIVDQDVEITHNAPSSYGTVGPKVITFTATDDHGNQSGRTAIISVQYDFHGFLAPLNLESDPDAWIRPIKYGKIVPVMFELNDYYGEIVPDVQAYILVYPSQGDMSGDEAIVL